MDQTEAESTARHGYDRMAEVYTNHVALEMTVPSLVRSLLESFVHEVQQRGPGKVADVGCGPGHVTAFLAELGLDIFGVDNSPALLDIARANHPEIRFETGQLASLPVDTGSLQAVVAKHSLIHTPADLVPAVLEEFARVLAPGGLLFLSFFGSEQPSTHGQGFDHAVTTAYQLDVEIMAQLVSDAGLTEELRIIKQPGENERQLPHGTFFARR
ncbi:MAG: class I SAM-dependent methyltransferase [Acidimicrobiales bacterium]